MTQHSWPLRGAQWLTEPFCRPSHSAVHLPKSSKRQIIGTLDVVRGYQIKQPGRQQQLRDTLGSGKASRGSPPSNSTSACTSQCPTRSLGNHSPVQALRRSPKAKPSRSSEVRNESPTSPDCRGGPASSWFALRASAAESRIKRVLSPIRPRGTPDPHGRPGRRWGRLAGDETKSPPRCGPRSSAQQPLPPHSLAFPGLPFPLPVSHPSLW